MRYSILPAVREKKMSGRGSRSADASGAQRAAKVIGIFTRLSRRDGKHSYLRHILRVWRRLEDNLGHPGLAGVAAWFDEVLPPEQRRQPETPGKDRRT